VRGLAYWIRDDGSIQNKGLYFNVCGFSLDEVINLKISLENLFLRYPFSLSSMAKSEKRTGQTVGMN